MVSHLPPNQQKKALRYGLIGAYVFRGACLFIASWLMSYMYLKIIGGVYLLYLSIKGLTSGEEDTKDRKGKFGLWGTVVMVEIMDLVFSIDNVFAAVALSDKFWVIMTGVGIGILAMRFVAGKFVVLMEKYPSLAHSAYIVILLLGLKLVVDGGLHYVHHPIASSIEAVMTSHWFDGVFSAFMMLIFFIPLLKKRTHRVFT